MVVWNDPAAAEAYRQNFPGWGVLALSPEQMLTAVMDQREKGVTHVAMELTGEHASRSLLTVDEWITITSDLVAGRARLAETIASALPESLTPDEVARSASVINPAFRVNPADFLVGMPKACDLLDGPKSTVDILLTTRVRIAKIMAEDLGIPVSETEAISIAKNSLSPVDIAEPVPLTPRERTIAEEIHFHAWTAFGRAKGTGGFDARKTAKATVAAGERGRRQPVVGCLPVVVLVAGFITFLGACILL